MPVLSRDMEEVLRRSTASAAERGHGRATLEHLLLALGESEEGGALLDACAVDRARLRAGLEPYLDTAPTTIPGGTELAPTNDDVTRVLRRASIHCQSAGRGVVHSENVIISLFSETRSPAVALLREQGMTRLDALQFIVDGIRKTGSAGEGA